MMREKRQRTDKDAAPPRAAPLTGKAGTPSTLSEACLKAVRELRKHPLAAPFNQPVAPHEAPDYAQVLAAAAAQVCTRTTTTTTTPPSSLFRPGSCAVLRSLALFLMVSSLRFVALCP